LLEVKSFDRKRGPGFDLANFDAYCNSLLTSAYRLDSDYLVFAYQMAGGELSIENVWVKKIWELACRSGTYPLKVQEKKNVIYNIRPGVWYSERSKFKPFGSLGEFLSALNETRYRYPQTRHTNAHWLQNVLDNYEGPHGHQAAGQPLMYASASLFATNSTTGTATVFPNRSKASDSLAGISYHSG